MSRLADKVAQCSSWKQLFHAALAADEANELNKKGIYYSNLRFCSADKLNTLLHQVRDGAPLNTITRQYGLRQKVQELMTA